MFARPAPRRGGRVESVTDIDDLDKDLPGDSAVPSLRTMHEGSSEDPDGARGDVWPLARVK